MGKFGWSLPPGVRTLPGEEPDPPCFVCGQPWEKCICPECPVCQEIGWPDCYRDHGLRRTEKQKFYYEINDRAYTREIERENKWMEQYLNEKEI